MRTARAHPQLGWLRLQARDYSRSLDRLLLERDKLNDPNYSGPAPAYLYWVANEELPQLARQPFYQQQIQQQLQDLAPRGDALQQQIHQQAGALLDELEAIEAEVLQLTALVEMHHGG